MIVYKDLERRLKDHPNLLKFATALERRLGAGFPRDAQKAKEMLDELDSLAFKAAGYENIVSGERL